MKQTGLTAIEAMQYMVDIVSYPIVVFDKNGKAVMCSKSFAELVKCPIEDVVKKHYLNDFIPSHARGGHEEKRKRAHKEGYNRRMNGGDKLTILDCEGSETPVEIELMHHEVAGEKYSIATISDRTNEVRLIKKLNSENENNRGLVKKLEKENEGTRKHTLEMSKLKTNGLFNLLSLIMVMGSVVAILLVILLHQEVAEAKITMAATVMAFLIKDFLSKR